MKAKIFYFISIFLVLSVITCDKKPTAPVNDNPFDIENPETGGDPFQLTAIIANGGITLAWNKTAFEDIHLYKVHRSEQENTGYTELAVLSTDQTQYIDKQVENGHSYWYLVTALDSKSNETSRTNTSAININTEPLIVINGGEVYTKSREVSLTILAISANQMMISSSIDFADSDWEPYTTSKNWTLTSGEGQKTIYLKIQYGSSESQVVQASILPQPMNPSILIADGAQYTSTNVVQLTLTANGENLQIAISEDSTIVGIDWQEYATTLNFELTTGDSQKILYVKFKNDFEIVSSVLSDDIILDTTPPHIFLTVTPDSGITNETSFEFNPMASSDNLSQQDDLQIRFDYENDGSYDTNWGQLTVNSQQLTVGGGDKNIKMQLQDGACWQVDTTVTIFVNTRPQASFTYSQDKDSYKLYHFDVSASSDYEDGLNLEYRWDFNNDGSWATNWITQDTISYTYDTAGQFTVKLSVRDQEKLSSEILVDISVSDSTMVVDIDGNVYQTIKIGNQWWMAENLKVIHYNNGEAIPNITDNTTWRGLTSGASCNYNNNSDNTSTYGLLYNWYAVNDNRSIAPEGWHVPTDEEWKVLEMHLGMSQTESNNTWWRGSDEGGQLKEAGTVHWNTPNTGATNTSEFTALPGGYRYYDTGDYSNMGDYGYWWCYSESGTTSIYRALNNFAADVFRSSMDEKSALSVRCVRD